jgi:hypothetical protein
MKDPTQNLQAGFRKVAEVGDRMEDGTVIIDVDLENDRALFAPQAIFGRRTPYFGQYEVVDEANAQALHGHRNWRAIKHEEAQTLVNNWDKVAPPELQGNKAPYFWGEYINVDPLTDHGASATLAADGLAIVFRGDREGPEIDGQEGKSRFVAIVRTGPCPK